MMHHIINNSNDLPLQNQKIFVPNDFVFVGKAN